MLGEATSTPLGALALLGLGFVLGLKHATEVDHIVAVSTVVSEQRKLARSILVGALWGAGHTASLAAAGILVLALRVAIPARVADWLEFAVALMIIGLGASALAGSLRRRRADAHIHRHRHDNLSHVHVHFHERETEHTPAAAAAVAPVDDHSHALARVGFKPLVIGAVHGLAGSAALTLLVLAQVDSAALGVLYLAIFGLGSILGMVLMSGLIGLPFALAAHRVSGLPYSGLQTIAGAVSVVFGLWYAYETGFASGLLPALL